MTYQEAKKILHPETSYKALLEIERRGFGVYSGKEAVRQAVDKACLVACEALDKLGGN